METPRQPSQAEVDVAIAQVAKPKLTQTFTVEQYAMLAAVEVGVRGQVKSAKLPNRRQK